MDVQSEINNLKKSVELLKTDNSRLTRDNNEFKRLINDHAIRINKVESAEGTLYYPQYIK